MYCSRFAIDIIRVFSMKSAGDGTLTLTLLEDFKLSNSIMGQRSRINELCAYRLEGDKQR